MAQQMTDLGEHAGFKCFWADPEHFLEPGFYIASEGEPHRAWQPVNDVAGSKVVAVTEIPGESGAGGLAVEFSNGVQGAFRLPVAPADRITSRRPASSVA